MNTSPRAAFAAGLLTLTSAMAQTPGVIPGNQNARLAPSERDIVITTAVPVMQEVTPQKTIGAILKSAGAPSGPAAQEAFIRSWTQRMCETEFVNQGVRIPLTVRKECQLDPAKLLAPYDAVTNPHGLVSSAITYRLDKMTLEKVKTGNTTKLVAHDCGEIAHSMAMGDGLGSLNGVPLGNVDLIAEFKIPNPDTVNKSPLACVPMAQAIESLSVQTPEQKVTTVNRILFKGIGNGFGPVVDFKNLQGDVDANGNELAVKSGRFRANVFYQELGPQEWLLREFQLVTKNGKPTFKTQGIAEVPYNELWKDPVAGEDAALTQRKTDFHAHVVNKLVPRIMNPELTLAQQGQTQMPQANFLANLNADIPVKFRDGETINNTFRQTPFDDDIATFVSPTLKSSMQTKVTQLNAVSAWPSTIDQTINKIRARGCSGCHEAAVNLNLAPATFDTGFPNFSTVVQPQSQAFLHIAEPKPRFGVPEATPSLYMEANVFFARAEFTHALAQGTLPARYAPMAIQPGTKFRAFGVGGGH